MDKVRLKIGNIDEYIALFPEEIRVLLQQMREVIQKSAPGANECISYGMPAFRAGGILVYFAAYEKHIGFYPTPSGIEAFKEEFSAYKSSKGAVQFPLDKPLPVDLISRIVQFRLNENLKKRSILHKK